MSFNEKRRPSQTMREAVRKAVSGPGEMARDMAYTLAERQRDERLQRAAPRTSEGYDRYMRTRRKAGQ